MTIREIEAQSGMTRANIRFYEAEGLLSPQRLENGYRNYSQDDLNTLRRVWLLRSLGVSIEEIRALQSGEEVLTAVLEKRLAALQGERARLGRVDTVCREMLTNRAAYADLDAQRYLQSLAKGEAAPPPAPAADAAPRVTAPWRRYFARCFDLFLYSVLWQSCAALIFRVNILQTTGLLRLADFCLCLLLAILLEPLFLHFFGATPGKWLLGLRVADLDGGRLTIASARRRTVSALWFGMGFGIPVYELIRLYVSRRDCLDGIDLRWEYDSTLSLKDKKAWRTAAYPAAVVLLSIVLAVAGLQAVRPPHRGGLTTAQFCENFNAVAQISEADEGWRLTPGGSWQSADSAVVMDPIPAAPPALSFETEDGIVTGVSFVREFQGEKIAPLYPELRACMVFAFAGA